MRCWGGLALRLILFLCCVVPGQAWAEKRIALVIGNGAYVNAPRLPNPPHDADDVAAALKNIGFDVIRGTDLDQVAMQNAVIRFAREAASADVGIFYFSGHAMQFNGVNYLMPIDARLEDEADLYRFTRVDDVMRYLQQVKALKILVLDSCRDNPLAERLKRSIGSTRAVSVQRGLATIEAPTGVIVSYATQAGRTAADGTGRNSPYTAAFLRHIEEPAEIGDIFRDISADVFRVTGEQQLPELSLSIIGKFYLKGPVSVAVTVPPRPVPADPCAAAGDHWKSAESIGTAAAFEDHLTRFPTCPFAGLATVRIEALKRQEAALAVPTRPQDSGRLLLGPGAPKPAAVAKPPQPAGPCGSAGAAIASLSSLRGPKPLTAGEECGLKPKDVFRECDKCPEMVVVPAGSFFMGGGDADTHPTELPRHQVSLPKPFAVGKTHVTRAQFMAFVEETGYDVGGDCFGGDPELDPSKSGNHPVVCVNLSDTNAYIGWLSAKTGQTYRLLTESEFEYAARAGTTTEWFWGDKKTDAKAYANCFGCGDIAHWAHSTVPAASLKPNAFGLYDMSGNAKQLVQDCYQSNYNGAPTDGSAWDRERCFSRVVRGGSWQGPEWMARSASREMYGASDQRTNQVGIRVARTLR
ncbi:MAG: SUMF1/EgtB/PvdO family nonheme iron enzyme [Bradyrhizobium sp.]|nr:SUMF1/EgtB/PvdO family nonheme iron enzyme [Bradyrhizobium sp.]